MRLTTVFVLCAGMALSGCARIPRGEIFAPHIQPTNPFEKQEQSKPTSSGDKDCVPVNEVEIFCPNRPPLPMS